MLKAYDVDITPSTFSYLLSMWSFPIKTPHMVQTSRGDMDPAEPCLTLPCAEMDEFIMRSFNVKFFILSTSCSFESVTKFLLSLNWPIVSTHTLQIQCKLVSSYFQKDDI